MPSTYAGADVFPSSITIPSDGDPRSAASVNVALEGLADRTTYLFDRVSPTVTATTVCVPIAGDWTGFGGWTGLFTPAENFGLIAFTAKQSDLIEIAFSSSFYRSLLAVGVNQIRIGVSENAASYTDGAATWVDAGRAFGAGGSARLIGWQATGGTESVDMPVTLVAMYSVVAANPTVRIVVQGDVHISPSPSALWNGSIKAYRPVP